jgi:hypothetical protein
MEDDNDRRPQFHPLTFGEHPNIVFGNFFKEKTKVGLMRMIFRT